MLEVTVCLTSGEVTKACVAGLASFLAVKFLLKDVTIVFFSPFFTSCLQDETQCILIAEKKVFIFRISKKEAPTCPIVRCRVHTRWRAPHLQRHRGSWTVEWVGVERG